MSAWHGWNGLDGLKGPFPCSMILHLYKSVSSLYDTLFPKMTDVPRQHIFTDCWRTDIPGEVSGTFESQEQQPCEASLYLRRPIPAWQ